MDAHASPLIPSKYQPSLLLALSYVSHRRLGCETGAHAHLRLARLDPSEEALFRVRMISPTPTFVPPPQSYRWHIRRSHGSPPIRSHSEKKYKEKYEYDMTGRTTAFRNKREQRADMICFFLCYAESSGDIKRWLRSPRYVTTKLGGHTITLFSLFERFLSMFRVRCGAQRCAWE